jgi:hypothetical protein
MRKCISKPVCAFETEKVALWWFCSNIGTPEAPAFRYLLRSTLGIVDEVMEAVWAKCSVGVSVANEIIVFVGVPFGPKCP